ncbi:MAG: SRPBCC domain-containing protein [Actinomycetota bacterium]
MNISEHSPPSAGARRHQFACFTAAGPTRVWFALTEASQIGAYLYGLAAHSSWQAEATIEFRTAGNYPVSGRVLHACEPSRLSYILRGGPGDPPVYLTWQVRPSPGGCIIRLQVDEINLADCDEDAEVVWLPVLAALQELLARDPQAQPSADPQPGA